MTPRVLRAGSRAAVPWRNGGGVTREIASWPENAGTAGFDWRISLAEVAGDGPFSVFPGVDRILTMVEGAGMDLTVGGRCRRVDERYVPASFPGDLPTGCLLLSGPVVNFNVMYARDRTAAEVAVVRGALPVPVPVPVPDGGTVVAVSLETPMVLETAATRGGTPLDRYDAAVLTPGSGPVTLQGEGRAALVTLRTVPPARSR
ncbi:HutD family protein [Streptomyces sp. JV176]|uniref:HutD/Ves family protein n=1 Tax=Streptomyces sp. JV176 TaxID=858630 RepID=UPI002E759FC0|nr:HutD family protein [Streptomyces sp. JV176]MEE1801642.1 HutD family protein [Streptomyces sp. JV176]